MKPKTPIENQVYCRNEIINFYLQNYQRFLRYSFRICNKKSLAEDVMQDVFVSFFTREGLKVKKLDQFITKSIKFNTLKKLKRNSLLTSSNQYEYYHQMVYNGISHYDFLAEKIILKEIEKLPEKRKKIFKMKRLQRKSTKDVSEQLNISIKTVENHLTLAVKQLKPKLNYLNLK